MRAFGLFLLLLLIGAAGLAYDGWQQLNLPLVVAQPGSVEMVRGERLSSLLLKMNDSGQLADWRQGAYLFAYARLRGQAGQVKAGEYALNPGMTPLVLLGELVSGKPLLHGLRLVEGWRFAQAWAAIKAEPNLEHALPADDNAALMSAIDHPGQDPEGRFFPDTYSFPRGTTDAAFLRHAYAAMDKLLATEWAGRAADLPYQTPDQALILASLVEKETGLASERPMIAGVFVRRLRLGMRLQTDPSVIYGMGAAFDGNLRLVDLRTDTPYNSYTRDGLPPTPICLPGRDSIHAAMHPDDGKALYFVSRGDGSHQFSDTLEEHNAAVQRYQIDPARAKSAPPPTQTLPAPPASSSKVKAKSRKRHRQAAAG